MTDLKFYLLCFMIAAPQGALGSAAEEFVEKWVDFYNNKFNLENFESISDVDSEECFSEALNRGAQAVQFDSGYCTILFYTGSACFKDEGQFHVYARKDYLTNESPDDSAQKYVDRIWKDVPDLRYYRIESPTIFEFGDITHIYASYEVKFKYFMTTLDGNRLVYSTSPAFVDPSCYTTSACSYLFLTTAPEIPESDILVLYDICGQSIQVDSGKSFYVLSHEGIGCKYFPNDYPVDNCWAEFTGAGEITVNVTLVNFRESDQCDGFTMTAVTDDANGSSASTDLCDATAPTELTSAGGKVRIEFGGSASPTREKYGFDIQVTAA